MRWILRPAGLALALAVLVAASPLMAQQAEKRIAFVVGDAAYQAAALQTPANDAGLLAQTLQAAGFEVVGARDLDQAAFVNAWNDFLAKAQAAGPDAVAFVYLAGYGLQLEGENYFASVDSQIATSADIATNAIRVSDISGSLASVPLKARILVFDAARANPFALDDPTIAGGLALVDPDDGALVAFNAAPGTIAPENPGPYGPYAQALAEMIGQGGLPLDEVFTRTRMRVSEVTKGAFMPWNASKVSAPFAFRDGAPDAASSQARNVMAKPVAELGPQDGYAMTLRLDTVDGYQGFLAAYPSDPLAPRVRAILAARREAIVWRRTYLADTPNAYGPISPAIPHGPHAGDARRRLEILAAALEPPPAFEMFVYDQPPPPPEELVYVERPVLMFGEPAFGFAEPPPPPDYFLPPMNPMFVMLPPPPPPAGPMFLPVPRLVPFIVNNQPYRPSRQVALPMVTATRPLDAQKLRLAPLVNPALKPDSLKQNRPLLAPGARPLVNPQQVNVNPQPLLNQQKLPNQNRLQPLNQQQLHVNQPPAGNAALPGNKLHQSNHGSPNKPPLGTVNQQRVINNNQQRVINNQQRVITSTAPANKLNAAKPLSATNPAGQAHVNTNAAKPLNAAPQNRIQSINSNVRPQVVNRAPVVAPRQVTAPPKPPPAAPRQAAAPPKPPPAPPCGRPGQPPCKR